MTAVNMDRVWNLVDRRQSVSRRGVLGIVEVGSTIYLGETGEDDIDLAGVFVEPAEVVVMAEPQSHQIRTQPDGVRSRMGDIDIIMHPLRKFARLLMKGNPSILTTVFSPNVHYRGSWSKVRDLHGFTASKQAGYAFQGYMAAQVDRWVGVRGQKNVSRPDLVEKYGYDTKYAYHAIRLGIQGIEYLETGRLELPLADVEALRSVRLGTTSEREALEWAEHLKTKLAEALTHSDLPEYPNTIGLAKRVAAIYQDVWSRSEVD